VSAQAEAFQAAVTLLRDLAPYDQCRLIVQMTFDGSLTQQQGRDLLSALVEYEIEASVQVPDRKAGGSVSENGAVPATSAGMTNERLPRGASHDVRMAGRSVQRPGVRCC
jgi:hypothetical protein